MNQHLYRITSRARVLAQSSRQATRAMLLVRGTPLLIAVALVTLSQWL